MNIRLLLSLPLAVALIACGGGEPSQELAEAAEKARQKVDQALPEDPPANIAEALERMGDAIADGEKSVPAADLKGLLPEKLAGMDRVSYEAQRTGVGVTVSKAQARYEDDDKGLTLMITDLGAASGLASLSRKMFESEIDREDANGFERTTEYKGHRSYQRLFRGDNLVQAEAMVFVDDRFTVQLEGRNIDWDAMQKALDDVDIDGLQALRKTVATN